MTSIAYPPTRPRFSWTKLLVVIVAMAVAIGATLVGTARPAKAQLIVGLLITVEIVEDLAGVFAEVMEAATVASADAATLDAAAAPVAEAGEALADSITATGEDTGLSTINDIRSTADEIRSGTHASLADGGAPGLTASELSGKTVGGFIDDAANSGAQESELTLSGWGNSAGYRTAPGTRIVTADPQQEVIPYLQARGIPIRGGGALDQGVTGQYNASHAEVQAYVISARSGGPTNTFAVSRPMCDSCQAIFRDLSLADARTVYVAAPNGVTAFSDGVSELIPWSSLATVAST